MPEVLETPNRLKVNRLEALCIFLRRMAYPCRLSDVGELFGRHPSDVSLIFKTVLNNIHEMHSQRLLSLDHPWLDVAALSESVVAKGSPLPRCFGFIDGTVRPIARPSENQKECYNGHKRVHALKFQAVTLPNGIIGHLFGPLSGRRHDSALLSESGLMPELQRVAPEYYIYGDQAYPLRRQLIAPFRGAVLTENQENFNHQMGKLRMCVEWSFGKIIQYFSFLDYKKNQKLFLQPVAKHYLVGGLLTNCHTCLYGSVTTSYFDCPPPSLEDYLY
ncbi:protein ALP1-like [Elysia marginata]|uniref:Protein ALP1-like n=1 Tax=Elysia marginata TaxID=1093978 RepID=A0AAV4FM04_9GAST|nr:protein ALP1-like [Elysia marginata]